MKSYLKTKDYTVSNEEFELLLKEDLDMLVTQPLPENLNVYYQSESYISHTDANKSLVDKMYQTVKKVSLARKVKLMNAYADDKKTVMDFGAGTGDFLQAAAARGWQVHGVEPNWGARRKASEKGVNLVPEITELQKKKYQIITLWHVLEHLPDLENQIEALTAHLEENGTMFIAVPNFRSFDAQHYGTFWAAYDVPRHLWHFSRTSIQKLFARVGMEVVKIHPMYFDSFYVSLLSEKYKTGKQRYLSAFFNGLLSNVKAWSSNEYSSLMYVLQRKKTH